MKTLLLALGIFAAAGCASQPSLPNLASAPHADIAVTSSPNTNVLLYATAPSAFALRGSEMKVRADTIHATTPVNLTAFLNAGDIHVDAAGSVPIEVQATLSRAPATRLGAKGSRIVLMSGGAGIR
jgi:hypothetical protein